MNHEYSALDLQCLNERQRCGSFWNELSGRDCLAVVVILGLAAGWGADRWRAFRTQTASATALADARAALKDAQKDGQRLAQQFRIGKADLVAQLVEEKETMGKLRLKIAALEAELRPAQGVRYAVGRER